MRQDFTLSKEESTNLVVFANKSNTFVLVTFRYYYLLCTSAWADFELSLALNHTNTYKQSQINQVSVTLYASRDKTQFV